MTKPFPGHPLFDTFDHFHRLGRSELFSASSPSVEEFVGNVGVAGALDDYRYTKSFLSSCNKSHDTYDKFRGDAERFLLWLWLIKEKSVADVRRSDLEEFLDFVVTPDPAWIIKDKATRAAPRFIDHEGLRKSNHAWRPFRHRTGQISSSSIKTLLANLNCYFKYLLEEEYGRGVPVSLVQKNSRYLTDTSDSNYTERRFKSLQWEYLLSAAERLADESPAHERTLFVVATLKALKLRVSELSDRANWQPVMSHFFHDTARGNDFWWLRVFGKGDKKRKVSVPTDYLPYLARYRASRGLEPTLPSRGSSEPLVASRSKGKGIGSRQLRNIVDVALKAACDELTRDGFKQDAADLAAATTHWLRHTGASMEIEKGRRPSHTQADLGHTSLQTTLNTYHNTDDDERGHSAHDVVMRD